EAQAAMALEHAIANVRTDEVYPYKIVDHHLCESEIIPTERERDPNVAQYVLDWEPLFRAILDDIDQGLKNAVISAKFHNTLVDMIVAMSQRAGFEKIVLSGGCFQNRYLLERTVKNLLKCGFRPYWNQRVPTNDGGLALGQVMGAIRESSKEKK
ncbi:MAG: carbamoyltransferase HypF, partial [Chlamydiota bacterium]|nr:carbamoyltransferase HypF [Chlamydiota bacterium]